MRVLCRERMTGILTNAECRMINQFFKYYIPRRLGRDKLNFNSSFKSMGRFKKGLVLGGLVGAGLAWMALTPAGRKLRDRLLDESVVLYEQVKKKALASQAWKDLNEQKYVALVRETVDKYVTKNPAARKAKDLLVKVLAAQWSRIQAEVRRRK